MGERQIFPRQTNNTFIVLVEILVRKNKRSCSYFSLNYQGPIVNLRCLIFTQMNESGRFGDLMKKKGEQ